VAARPKFSPDVQQRICDAIALGATYDLAAKYGGVTYETFNEWRKHKPSFSEALQEAEGRAAIGWLTKIEHAATQGTWQAAAWKLERRYPDEYGRTVQQLQGKDGGPIQQATLIEVRYVNDWRRQGSDEPLPDAGGDRASG
jgi:hypothetical protein